MVISAATAEAVLFFGGMLLNVFILPSLIDKDAAVPKWQSLPSALALIIIAVGYGSLGLFWPMASVLFGAVLWILVAIFRST